MWAAPLLALYGLWLWFAFSSGGYGINQWPPLSLALGVFGLTASLLVAYPRRPRQFSLLLLSFLGSYGFWTLASAIWAESITRAWLEAGRTLTYLLVFALALIYLTDHTARRMSRYALMAAAATLLASSICRLALANNIEGVFSGNHFAYPVSYHNGAAALFLVAFWPLMWLAAGSEERAPVRAIALGLSTGLLGLALMTWSYGAFFALTVSMAFFFLVCPGRSRLLLYLLVPALLMLYEFPLLNQYRLESPETIGGGLAARTLLVASVTAAFIGLVLALLEKWISVTFRMKSIFTGIVVVAVLAGAFFGISRSAEEAGGPSDWISSQWQQYTQQVTDQSESAYDSAPTTVLSLEDKTDLWRVAWLTFKRSAVLGVGADNFVFQYERLRTEALDAQQAHSLEMQLLSDTGSIGMVLFGCSVLVALGGILWPRCAASRRPTRRVLWRQAASRWGSDPRAYGWQMALLAGSAYWLIHSSIDWLWEIPAVAIPAFLLLAEAIATIDARIQVLWPRLNRPSRGVSPLGPASSPAVSLPQEAPAASDDDSGFPVQLGEFLAAPRRSDRYAARMRKRARKAQRRRYAAARMRPAGPLSQIFRVLLVALSCIVIIVAGLPYLSVQIQASAKALAVSDSSRAVERAALTHWLQPWDPGPYLTEAHIHENAAYAAALSAHRDRAGATFDNLALAIDRLEQAIAREPGDWSLYYRAGVTSLNLILARCYVSGNIPQMDYQVLIPKVPGLANWWCLLGASIVPPEPGDSPGSLATTESTRKVAARYRALPTSALLSLGHSFLQGAQMNNPLAPQVQEAALLLEEIKESASLRQFE